MKTHLTLNAARKPNRSEGFTLLDILLAIVIFVIGMLALAHLQGNLTRSSSDANVRTVASNIGEEILEELRAYRLVFSDPDGVEVAFADFDKAYVTRIVPRGGLNYSVTGTVIGYDFDSNFTDVIATDPAIAGEIYDFKVVELKVSWDNNPSFQIDDENQLSNTDMKTGSILLREIIPSVSTLASAAVAAQDEEGLGYVPVQYTPGEMPDIVPISLAAGKKFKESSTPVPDVIRPDQTAETWFDVITYNQSNTFQRREEFLVVSCDCELRRPAGPDDLTGRVPTVWTGTEYKEGEMVSKLYGVTSNLQQSFYCSTCCRDHHDPANEANPDRVYDPKKDWTAGDPMTGAHEHYSLNKLDEWEVADSSGDGYLEACRMVRKDGFMRVAQDFRQEGFFAVQESFFNNSANIANYSSYVTSAVDSFFGTKNPTKTLDSPADAGLTLPGDTDANPIPLPTPLFSEIDQQVSRAIYVDHLSAELITLVDCLAEPGNSATECGASGVEDYLEVMPFYELQTTKLSWWEENSNENPVSVTNLPLKDGNEHSRGKAEIETETPAMVHVSTSIHRGNIGLAGTDPIDDYYYSRGLTDPPYIVYVDANESDGVPPVVSGTRFSGSISSAVKGVDASLSTFTGGDGVNCNLLATEFYCIIDDNAFAPTLKIEGYSKPNADVYVCEISGLVVGVPNQSPVYTMFDLSVVAGDMTTIRFVIQTDPC